MKYQVALKTGGYLSNVKGSTSFSLATAKKYAAEFLTKQPKMILKVTPEDLPHHLIRWDIKAVNARKTPKNSALAILKELESKPRKNPRGRVAKKAYIIQHLIAPNDVNGNPKRGWLVWWHADGKVIGFVDEGYKGRQALGEYLKHTLIDLGSISVTGAIYTMAKKELRVDK